MALYLFITIISIVVHFVFIIPFIHYLYKKKFQRAFQKTKDAFDKPTPIFDKFHQIKSGTPVGGGILIIIVTTILFLFFLATFLYFGIHIYSIYDSIFKEITVLLVTFLSFSLLGLYDDLSKIFYFKERHFFGIKLKTKLLLEFVLAMFISLLLYFQLGISIIHIPFIGVFDLSWGYIFFATFVIVSFANAVNITDGLDGLSSGVLMIALMSFWAVARSIIDVPLSVFIAVWVGGLIAFLYFNIYPARIMLGDTGALSFGATLAVIGLLLGKSFALPIIGGVFVIEIMSSFMQLLSKRFRKKKVFIAAPFHLQLQHMGWEEPKIVQRFWIISVAFALIGLMIAFLK
jgi:phospho-N-acetylmuramoyl-pentapeptide-transferase